MTITNNIDKAIANIHNCENKLTSSIAILQLLKNHYAIHGMNSDTDYSVGKSICVVHDFISEALSCVSDVGDYVAE